MQTNKSGTSGQAIPTHDSSFSDNVVRLIRDLRKDIGWESILTPVWRSEPDDLRYISYRPFPVPIEQARDNLTPVFHSREPDKCMQWMLRVIKRDYIDWDAVTDFVVDKRVNMAARIYETDIDWVVGNYKHTVRDWSPMRVDEYKKYMRKAIDVAEIIANEYVSHSSSSEEGDEEVPLPFRPKTAKPKRALSELVEAWDVLWDESTAREISSKPVRVPAPVALSPFNWKKEYQIAHRRAKARERNFELWRAHREDEKRTSRWARIVHEQEELDKCYAYLDRLYAQHVSDTPKVRTQSGTEHAHRRYVRDEQQKRAAKAAAKEERRATSKRLREQSVLKRKNAAMAARVIAGDSAIVTQGGKHSAAILAGAALVGAAIQKASSVLGSSIDRASARCDSVAGSMTGFFNSLKEQLVRIFGGHVWVVPVLVVILYIYRTGEANHDRALLMLSMLTPFLAPHLWSAVADLFRKGDVHTQAGGEPFCQLLSTALAFSIFGSKCKDQTGEFLRRVANIERVSNGFGALMDWTFSAIQCVLDYVCGLFGKEAVQLRKEKHKDLKDWVSAVRDADVKSSAVDVCLSSQLPHMYIALLRQGQDLAEAYRSDRVSSQVIAASIMTVKNLLSPLQGALNARNNYRPEPVYCLFRGKAGIGKTVMTQYFCGTALSMSGLLGEKPTAEDIKNNMWQKGSSEFWNGYIGQECLVMDDAHQPRVSTSDKENEFINAIHAISSWSCPLNFADLNSKGKIYFTSRLMFGTTNATSLLSEADKVINCPEAFFRRIRFPYELELDSDFATHDGFIDMVKLETARLACGNATGFHSFPWHIWRCYKYDYSAGRRVGPSESLADVLKAVSCELATRSARHSSDSASFDKYLTKIMAPSVSPVETQGFLGIMSKVGLGRTVLYGLEHLQEHLRQMHNEDERVYKRVATWVIPVTVSLAAGYLAWKGVVAFLHTITGGKFKKDKNKECQSNRKLSHATKVRKNHVVLQSGTTAISNMAYANSFKLIIHNNGTDFSVGQITMLNDRLAVAPYHFSVDIKRKVAEGVLGSHTTVSLTNTKNTSFVLKCSLERFMSFQRVQKAHLDVEFIKLSLSRACRNITKSFVQERDLRNIDGYAVRIDTCDVTIDGSIVSDKERLVYFSPYVKVGGFLHNGTFDVQRHLEYKAHTVSGDCGGVISMIEATSFQGRVILGFHTAAETQTSIAYGSIVTQEMIESARVELDLFDDRSLDDLERITQAGVGFTQSDDFPFKEMGSFLPIGVLSKGPVICPKSSLFKTEHYGIFGAYDSQPALMAPTLIDGVMVYPLENAVKPYGSPVLNFEQPWLKQIMFVALKKMREQTKHDTRNIFTFEEAVLGCPERKFRSIPRGTAAGFPYSYTVRNGKTEFFGSEDDYRLDLPACEELRSRVTHVLSQAKRGVRLLHAFVDFPKDELRTLKKVQLGQTRLISSAPLDYVIAFRMMFGAFTSAVMVKHTVTGMAPGICTYSEWHKVVNMLHKHGKQVFAGDFKQFDASEQPCIHELILEAVNEWYNDGEDNARIRRVLWLELTHSRHVGGLGRDQRFLYQWAKSLPSGHPATTIVNSVYSLFCLVAAYYCTTGDLVGFWESASAVTYGDDNGVGVSDAVAPVYNQATVAKALKEEFDMVYTSDQKDADLGTTTDIGGITFLKRGFAFEGGRVLCPLDMDSFMYTVYWCKNKMLEKQIAVDVLEIALQELSLHSKNTWDLKAPEVYKLLSGLGEPKCPLDRECYLALVQSRTDSWF